VVDVIEIWRGDRLVVSLPARAIPVGSQTHVCSAAMGESIAFTRLRVLRDGKPILTLNRDWRAARGDGIGINLGRPETRNDALSEGSILGPA